GFARAAVGQIYLHDFTDPSADGSRGYVIEHPENEDFPQDITPIGDFNGDGYHDFAVSNPSVNFQDGGEIFIFWGRPDAPPIFDPTTLRPENGGNPQAGMRIVDSDVYSTLGWSMDNVGDINGDGIDDLGIGSPEWIAGPGFAFVLFGRDSSHPFPNQIDLADLVPESSWGLRFVGNEFGRAAGVQVLGLGDTNGDGRDDLYILTKEGTSPGASNGAGKAYIIYGRTLQNLLPSAINVLSKWRPENGNDGSLGFVIENYEPLMSMTKAISLDINGDGLMDIAQDVDAALDSGLYYDFVIFGKPKSERNTIENIASLLQTGGNSEFGTAFLGDYPGFCITPLGKADIDNDGKDELLIYCSEDARNVESYEHIFVIWGKETDLFPPIQVLSNLLKVNGGDGEVGITIKAATVQEFVGSAQMNGDINSDGIDDLVIWSLHIVDDGGTLTIFDDIRQDVIRVIFGRSSKESWPVEFELSELSEANNTMDNFGYALRGEELKYAEPQLSTQEFAGRLSLIVPDVNGDGFNDMLIGTSRPVFPNTFLSKVYVLYGGPDNLPLPTEVVGAQAVPVPGMGIFQGLTLICLILLWGVFRINGYNDSQRF
ncbi:MAG: hypothetical protein ACWA5R_14035, partial [bacterium]